MCTHHSRTLPDLPLDMQMASVLCMEMMKPGAHRPHYFVTPEGDKADSNETLATIVTNFTTRSEERQVASFEEVAPTLSSLAISSNVANRVKGLTQLWEATHQPLLHKPIRLSALDVVAQAIKSGVPEVATLGIAVTDCLAVNASNWSALASEGVLRACTLPPLLTALGTSPDTASPLERHVASLVTSTMATARSRRLWSGTNLPELLSALLHCGNPVAIDAALVAMTYMASADVGMVRASLIVSACLCVCAGGG